MKGTEAAAPGIIILLATNSSSGQSAKRRKSQVYFFPLPLLPTTAADAAQCSPGGQPLFCKFYSLPPLATSLPAAAAAAAAATIVYLPPSVSSLGRATGEEERGKSELVRYIRQPCSLSLSCCARNRNCVGERGRKRRRERYFAAGNFCTISNRRRKRSRKERPAVSATTKIPQKL